jgi:hypothetical protein
LAETELVRTRHPWTATLVVLTALFASLATLPVSAAGARTTSSVASNSQGSRRQVGHTRSARCTGTLRVTKFAFSPSRVAPGQSSTARLTALDCTSSSEQASLTWLGRFSGSGGGIAAGCPVIDPLAQAADFAAHATFSAQIEYSIPSGCDAVALVVTARFSGGGGAVLASKSASLSVTS